MSFPRIDVNIRFGQHHNLVFALLLFEAFGRLLVIQFLDIQNNLAGLRSALSSESYNELLQSPLQKLHFPSKTFAYRQILSLISCVLFLF